MSARFVFTAFSVAFGLIVVLAIVSVVKHSPGSRASTSTTRAG
jgi:hypothetical protein